MNYVIDTNSKKPAYIQLYEILRREITAEVYRHGERLPSKRLLADETGVSVITVEHAYEILCDEGYVESRERRGYFVTYKKGDLTPVAERASERIINDIPSADGEGFPFSVFSKAMRSVITKYGERILVKSESRGCAELRGAISEYLARAKGITVTPDRIVIGSGAEYLYGLIVQLIGKDSTYAIENPSYEKIFSIYRANGVKCDLLTLSKNGILTSELERTSAGVLHVTPYRSFPSGVTASASKRSEYIEWAKKRNGYIIEDDFNSEFTVSSKNEDTLFSLEPQERVIYVNTFTKTVAPSMRIGYMVLPLGLNDFFSKKLGFYSCTVPTFEQYLLAELIENGDFERHINRTRRHLRQSLKAHLKQNESKSKEIRKKNY
ncbi:MAG: PLP-dependent aminotransferase family protein [Clostridia bacterium]|nr:PLP-dependent aminotransferase family protein [Clostridia bacterium]